MAKYRLFSVLSFLLPFGACAHVNCDPTALTFDNSKCGGSKYNFVQNQSDTIGTSVFLAVSDIDNNADELTEITKKKPTQAEHPKKRVEVKKELDKKLKKLDVKKPAKVLDKHSREQSLKVLKRASDAAARPSYDKKVKDDRHNKNVSFSLDVPSKSK